MFGSGISDSVMGKFGSDGTGAGAGTGDDEDEILWQTALVASNSLAIANHWPCLIRTQISPAPGSLSLQALNTF